MRPSLSLPLPGTLALLAVTLLAAPEVALAQAPEGLVEVKVEEPGRSGFWMALGLGAGGESYDIQPNSGYSSVLYRPTVSVRLGGTVGRHLRLGAEVLSWINEVGPAVESLSSGLVVAQIYPSTSGLYVKGGLGFGRNAVQFDDGYDQGDTGFAGLAGLGYELRLGKRFFLNPAVDFVGHWYENGVVGDYRERLVNFGLGILLQTGR
jgi:hypothetical protein